MSGGSKVLLRDTYDLADDWCTDYHCAGDCGLRGHGYQHAGARDDGKEGIIMDENPANSMSLLDAVKL
jgi:hypothetical protein